MPSIVNVKGGPKTRRPGVYAIVDASALAGRSLELGVVGIVGSFPFLEQAKPAYATSPRGIVDLELSDAQLPLISKLVYSPANDDRVSSSPSKVYFVNVDDVTQAFLNVPAAVGTSFKLLSNAWGKAGNRAKALITSDASGHDVTITRDGLSEEFLNLTFDDVITFKYTDTEATTMTVAYEVEGGDTNPTLTIAYTKTGLALVPYEPVKMAFDGVITIEPADAPVDSKTWTATVTGASKVTGLEVADVITWIGGAGSEKDAKPTSVGFSSVTSITLVASAGAGVTTFTISGDAFVLDTGEFTDAAALANHVQGFSTAGFTGTVDAPQAAGIGAHQLDGPVSPTDIHEVDGSLTADVQAIINALAGSNLVTAERTALGTPAPAAMASATAFAGGTKTTGDAGDWGDALDSLQTEDVQILVPWTSEDVSPALSDVHKKFRDHCKFMAGEGGNERNAWLGAAKDETEAQLFTRSKSLNSRHVSLVFQDITVEGPTGGVTAVGPHGLALIMAGMQAGTDVAVPLTHKYVNVLSIDQNASIKPTDTAHVLLGKGLAFCTDSRLGPWVERSITTYMTDDNPIWSEVTANESVNTSVRDLRQNLQILVGDPAVSTTANKIATVAASVLRKQVQAEIIKAFQNIVVDDLGDLFRVSYEVAAVEPVNFIVIHATVKRMPFSV